MISVLIPDWPALLWSNTEFQNILKETMFKFIPSLILSNSFKQVRVIVDVQPIPGTLSTQQECTPDGAVYLRRCYCIHFISYSLK